MLLQPICTAEQIEQRRAFRDHELRLLSEALATGDLDDEAFVEGSDRATIWARMAADSGEWADRLTLAGTLLCHSRELAKHGDEIATGVFEVEGLIVLDRLDAENCPTARAALEMINPADERLHVARIASALAEPEMIFPPVDDPTFGFYASARLCGEICREYDLQPHSVWSFMFLSPDLEPDMLFTDEGLSAATSIIVRGVAAPGHTLH